VRTPAQIKSKHGAVFCSRACHYSGRRLGLVKRVVTTPYQARQDPAITAANRAAAHSRTVATRRTNNSYNQSDATRTKLRVTTARAIAEGRIPAVSKLEDDVAAVLTAIGITYRRQHQIRDPETGRFCALCDFLLDDGRVLEVNGTFWHADIRKYPAGPRTLAQLRTADRWARKIAALSKLGIPLVVLWELDFRKNPTEAVQVALGIVTE